MKFLRFSECIKHVGCLVVVDGCYAVTMIRVFLTCSFLVASVVGGWQCIAMQPLRSSKWFSSVVPLLVLEYRRQCTFFMSLLSNTHIGGLDVLNQVCLIREKCSAGGTSGPGLGTSDLAHCCVFINACRVLWVLWVLCYVVFRWFSGWLLIGPNQKSSSSLNDIPDTSCGSGPSFSFYEIFFYRFFIRQSKITGKSQISYKVTLFSTLFNSIL